MDSRRRAEHYEVSSMSPHGADTTVVLPMLSRGKHRNARKGACFMEFASYLAGERWSDHPECTHPLLASLARQVNDAISDERRSDLVALIPSVVGLSSDDPHVDVHIALRAASTGLPIAAAERQRVLAVAVLSAEQVLSMLDGRGPQELSDRGRWALEQAPHAASWAREFADGQEITINGFRRNAAPTSVRCAVQGIAQACVDNPDAVLYDLLAETIDDCLRMTGRAVGHHVVDDPRLTAELAGLPS